MTEQEISANETGFFGKVFKDVSLAGEKILSKEFEDCRFESCDFTDVILNRCKFTSCQFVKCNLSMLSVPGCYFAEVEFEESKLQGVDWTKAYWRDLSLSSPLQFENCLLNFSSFYGLNLSQLKIKFCLASDVDFREGGFAEADFTGTDFSNSQFGNTNLTAADFSGASNYDIDLNNNKLKNATFSRFEAVRLLEALGLNLVD